LGVGELQGVGVGVGVLGVDVGGAPTTLIHTLAGAL
jgi:hypothetical protein